MNLFSLNLASYLGLPVLSSVSHETLKNMGRPGYKNCLDCRIYSAYVHCYSVIIIIIIID